jgi:Holliday junction resolvase RusA-like endonuclease
MAKRIQNSLGKYFHNEGVKINIEEEKYVLDRTRDFYLFDIVPFGAVRMTQRDRIFTNPNHPDPKKRQRPAVTKHFEFKNRLIQQANEMGFVLKETLDVLFIVPLPDSWSKKKKDKMNGMPCKSKPDCDNYVKLICDTLKKEDGDIWVINAEKRYGHRGSIIIFG